MRSNSALQPPVRQLARIGAAWGFACALAAATAPALSATGAVPVVVASETPVEVFVRLTSNFSSSFDNQLYVVPAGKVLIVDSASLVAVNVGSSPALAGLILNYDSSGNVVSASSVSALSSSALTAGTQAQHLHVVAGNVLRINVFATTGSPVSCYVSISGHLVDAP